MTTRAAAVAGRFYPGDPDDLADAVDTYLTAPAPTAVEPPTDLRALVAPHAGYVYSGPTAGTAYRLLPAGPPACVASWSPGPPTTSPCVASPCRPRRRGAPRSATSRWTSTRWASCGCAAPRRGAACR